LPAEAHVSATAVDWSRFAIHLPAAAGSASGHDVGGGVVRVRAPLLERLVTHAGEVGIARSRIESDMQQLQGSLKELTDNLDRLRRQLRDLELQAETQMASRMEAARHSQQAFDPLEMDRFTRVQELTRMLAESVGDVGTVQRGIQQTLQSTEDQLAMQARLTRDLQDDLLRARMVEFDTLSDRLYRVVRQAAKESGKQVRLNLIGGAIELDRSVLDRMAPAFEHLLRNAVAHGIESPAQREAAGKDPHGNIEVSLHQAGNEVRIEVRDDGAGLNLARIAERARHLGLLAEDARPTEGELAGMIFTPGFSTAEQVTELAGRGVGMDVVRAEVTSLGGRIETASATGRGTAFQLVLPLTTAVTQVVALACGELHVAVPATLVETVRRVPVAEAEAAYRSGLIRHGDQEVPFFWLGSLLQHGLRGAAEGRTTHVVIARSASQRVALHVSQVLGNQEVVVKNLGPQLARLPGLAGMSLLASGETVLIYNPVALATYYGDDARQRLQHWLHSHAAAVPVESGAVAPVVEAPADEVAIPRNENHAPLVLVVDDSLTVRRVTQRLLQREGYRVTLARDGLDALEKLADERPMVMLSDIEMPRMDGFDLVRNVRSDTRLHDLPVIMITSRIAQKHREHAQELGVDHYLGKPYDEEALLALVRSYAQAAVPA
jgi:chemosensory pili system protein ChpA (sensor histidine kinase/response regulator)